MIKVLFAVLSMMIIVSCRVSENRSIALDVPDTAKNVGSALSYRYKKMLTRELNLSELESGSKKLEIRLWVKAEAFFGGDVFIVKPVENKPVCLHYRYSEKLVISPLGMTSPMPNRGICESDSFTVYKCKLNTDWKSFMTKIEKCGIYSLPDQENIKGFKNIVSDGITYSVEFADTARYRFYAYNSPQVYSNRYDECRKMCRIIEVLKEEIDDFKQLAEVFNRFGARN